MLCSQGHKFFEAAVDGNRPGEGWELTKVDG